MSIPQKNQILELEISELSNLGYGIGHLENGITVFVQNALPGEKVIARIIKVTKTYLVAKLEELLRSSTHRITNTCSAKGCGGCIYRNVDYSYELDLKRNNVVNAFRKNGLNVTIQPILSTNQTKEYRNKAEFPVANGKDGMVFGFYAEKTHRVVPCLQCELQPTIFSQIALCITNFCTKNRILAYDEETRTGLLRHIYIRRGVLSHEIMVCLVINGDDVPNLGSLIGTLISNFPDIVSIHLNINKENTNVVLGSKFRCVYGLPYIHDVLCDTTFEIAPDAFWQVNHDACELLYNHVKNCLGNVTQTTVVDLYCGIGSIGLSVAKDAQRLIGIEIVPSAVKCAQKNAKENHIHSAHFYLGDASNAESFFENAEKDFPISEDSTIIIDPPRKGTTHELISFLKKRKFKNIIYVSCNPETLARDCVDFSDTYCISSITPVDMFPRTGHVETVVSLQKAVK